jgi:hypothetical protein
MRVEVSDVGLILYASVVATFGVGRSTSPLRSRYQQWG